MSAVPFTLLLVDDNELVLRPLARYLGELGFLVLQARDGDEALRQIDDHVDLVLLDIMMPGLSGVEVLKTVRQTRSEDDLIVIMITATNSSEQIIEAFEAGASDYITKPLDFPVVKARLQSRLRSRTPRRSRPRPKPSAEEPWLDVETGTILGGKYRLDARIGRGNFAEVFRGTHVNLDRQVAVKLLRAGGDDDAELRERFLREGRSTCRIEHPNAVAVLDAGVTQNGAPFLVTELLRGRTLEEEMKRCGPMTPLRSAEILLPICDVLAEAHMLGIVHRDIKPQNIFLHQAPQGEVVKVLDFGIAKLIGGSVGQKRLTLAGSGPGTPAYMAPERFSSTRDCDGQTDVYSLGVMLFKMLVGRLPFVVADGNLIKLAMLHRHETPSSLREIRPSLPASVESIVLWALAKDSGQRPSARELAVSYAEALNLEASSFLVSSAACERGSEAKHPRETPLDKAASV